MPRRDVLGIETMLSTFLAYVHSERARRGRKACWGIKGMAKAFQGINGLGCV